MLQGARRSPVRVFPCCALNGATRFSDPRRATLVTAEQYARIFALLKRNGTPIPVNDIWIAASAMEHGSELISNDEHFSLIATLRLKRL